MVTTASCEGSLFAADFPTNATTAVEDLASALGPHACTEAYGTAAFDVADSSWVVDCHRQFSIISESQTDARLHSGLDCSPRSATGLAPNLLQIHNLSVGLVIEPEISDTRAESFCGIPAGTRSSSKTAHQSWTVSE